MSRLRGNILPKTHTFILTWQSPHILKLSSLDDVPTEFPIIRSMLGLALWLPEEEGEGSA